jgi:predicted dehydrogenase
MHQLVIVNPGHFHAGLVLRENHPQISKDVYIYSEGGQDLANYLKLVESFNARAINPTDWRFHVYSGIDFLQRAVAEKKGDIAVLAGKNDQKIHYIKALHEAGFYILSDKPLTINLAGVTLLKQILSSGNSVMDIMTERHEITSLLQKLLMQNKDIFGDCCIEPGVPAIIKESVHHLYKTVNGNPLVRPPWYFDVNVQGEGIVDVTTHLADLIQWMLYDEDSVDYSKDVVLTAAKRWSTEVPLDKYQLITKQDNFPEQLASSVNGDILNLFCNGKFNYTIKGVPVELSVVWALQAPDGGGDTHKSVMKGTISDIIIDQGPQTGNKPELYLRPHIGIEQFTQRFAAALPQLGYPEIGFTVEGTQIRLEIPPQLRVTHEEHFAAVRDEFLTMLDSGVEPKNLRGNLLSKYLLLANARETAMG